MKDIKRPSDSNFWSLFSETVIGKAIRILISDILGLDAVASLKLDGAQLIHIYEPQVDLSLVSEDGAAPAAEMKLTGIYTHNAHPIATCVDGKWTKQQKKFMGLDVQRMWFMNPDPLQNLVDKIYRMFPDATMIKIYSELMHPTSGQVIKRQKGSIYTDSRPELIGTHPVFQACVTLPGKEHPVKFRPSNQPEMKELFDSVPTPEILVEGPFGPDFVRDVCKILTARHKQDEGSVIHLTYPDGREIGRKLRTGVTESGEVHIPFFNGTHAEIGHLSKETQSMIGSLMEMFEDTADEQMMKRATRSPEEMAAAQAARGKKDQRRGGRNKNTGDKIDMDTLRLQWNKLFTHADYLTTYNEIKENSDEVSNLRAQMLEAFKAQVIKDQVTSFLEEDGTLKVQVVKNIEGATKNMPAFMRRR
jgi:hypothetical protein